MSALSSHELGSRRLFDWEVVRRMNSPGQYLFSAHATAADAEKGCNPVDSPADARHAIHYRAEFHIKTLVGHRPLLSPWQTIGMSDDGNGQPSSPDLVDVLKQIEEHLAALRKEHDKSPGDWLTVEEAAKELKLSRDTIERLIGSGQMKAAVIDTPKARGRRSRYRLRRDWLEDYMRSKTRRVLRPVPQSHQRRQHLKLPHDFIG